MGILRFPCVACMYTRPVGYILLNPYPTSTVMCVFLGPKIVILPYFEKLALG